MCNLQLPVLDPTLRYRIQWILKQIHPTTPYISTKINIPIERLHRKLKQLSIFLIHLPPQHPHILIIEFPLSHTEIFNHLQVFMNFPVTLHQPENNLHIEK